MTDIWDIIKNKYAGWTGIIIGNGPSLNDIPISFLKKYPSFGSNRIYLLDGFRPTYHVCVNPLVIDQFPEIIKGIGLEASFVGAGYDSEHITPIKSLPVPHFSRDPRRGFYEGHTVTYVMMQIAYWMGFQTILLVGVDHYFEYEGQPNEERTAAGIDPNHFHPGYFSDGIRWNNPDLEMSERAYLMAKNNYELDGRSIYNCTTKTALTVFEKKDWKEFA